MSTPARRDPAPGAPPRRAPGRLPASSRAEPARPPVTSARSLFARLPAAEADGRAPDVMLHAEPTGDYGVGLLRMEHAAPCYFDNPPDDAHFVWLQHAPAVSSLTRLAGRRIESDWHPCWFGIYPAGADSTIEVRGPNTGTLLHVSAECLALAASHLGSHGSVLVEQVCEYDDELARIGRVLDAEASAGHPNGTLFWSSAADAFVEHLAAHHLSTPAAPIRGRLSRPALRRLDAHVHENLSEPLHLDRLAAVVGCDRFHFAHRFRATVGVSPHRYVMRLRLERARERIRAGTGSLAEIALDTGFTDQSHLCRWVRRVYGVRPSDLGG